MPLEDTIAIPSALAERYRAIRGHTEALCRPLAIDDYQVQSAPETSPPKWHLAHVTWFFETFLLKPFHPSYRPFDERYEHLFNSYYQGVGAFHPRLQRHVLSRPTVDEVYRYRAHVDAHVEKLIANGGRRAAEVAERIELGLNHEQQHQELLLMDIKRNFFANPLYPAYHEQPAAGAKEAAPLQWLEQPGGMVEIGHAGSGFAFDNEMPRHRVFLQEHRIASRLATNAEYLQFIQAGGYRLSALWLSDGWTAVTERSWQAPLYWIEIEGEWHEMTLSGLRVLDAAAPVCHVSYYEADAYARWCGARLPTESEWETAAARQPMEGHFAESGHLQPHAAGPGAGQWFGDVWEWTASPYTPYPGFRPLLGALGEYNGKFMANQYVLRGGCCATPQSHMRLTYRNFFYPHDRWAYAGIRLASDAH